MLHPPLDFFLFLTFFNIILISTRIGFYLQGVARLVAPLALARQIASVALGWPRWWPEPALRRVGDDMALPVAPHALARQGKCTGPAPAPSPPPSLSFPPPRPELQPGRRRRPPPPQDRPQIRIF